VENPLHKKLRVLPGQQRLLLGAPDDQRALLQPWDAEPDLKSRARVRYDWVLLFAGSLAELDQLGPVALGAVAEGGILWAAYPKLTSKLKSDISRDTPWAPFDAADWLPVTQVALDGTWSALRFRPRAEIPKLTRKF